MFSIRWSLIFILTLFLLTLGCEKDDSTSIQNLSPETPCEPNPVNYADAEPIMLSLRWQCSDPEDDSLTYDLYFGLENQLTLIISKFSENSYQLDELAFEATYSWKVVAYDTEGNSIEGPAWKFTTGSNSPPSVPSEPIPRDGSTDIEIPMTLFWSCQDSDSNALKYDLFIGITSPPPPLYSSGIENNSVTLDHLAEGVTYFWKIKAYDSYELSTESPEWTFTTLGNQPPIPPSFPFPEDGAVDQDISFRTSWSCNDPDDDSVNYDIYLGQSIGDLELLQSRLTDSTAVLFLLDENTTYYWRVIAYDSDYDTTEGSIWSFTTSIASELIPLAIGNTWYYSTTGGIITYSNSTSMSLNNSEWYNIYGEPDPVYLVQNCGDGFYDQDIGNGSGPRLLWKYPVELNESWTYSDIIEFEVSCISTSETVYVTAGVFSGCIKYQFSHGDNIAFHWIKPGLGYVKRDLGGGSVQVLISYSINVE
ncbi:MAG: hypothetical protein P9L92_20955 [Candidatus Electryonea clarkiae]|nr:hypothetical protein [Candidatus Electryonea clarkiae]MDP8285682.1 hypothetical protein [Candidatus Electryonea clarkiae]